MDTEEMIRSQPLDACITIGGMYLCLPVFLDVFSFPDWV